MKSFKQFCAEVRYASIGAKSKNWANNSEMLGRRRASVETDLDAPIQASGKIAGLGEWVLYRTRGDLADFAIVAYDLKQKAMVVATLFAAGTSYKVHHLVSQAGSSIRAADLYAAFVRSGRMLRSDEQSEGGRRVWVKLSQMKGVTVYGWDSKRKTPVNLGDKIDPDVSDIHYQPEFDDDVDDAQHTSGRGPDRTAAKKQMDHYYDVEVVAAPSNKNVPIIKPRK